MKQPFTEEWNRWLPEAKRVERGLLSELEPKIDSVIERVRGIAEDFYWAGFKAGERHAEEAYSSDRRTRIRDRLLKDHDR